MSDSETPPYSFATEQEVNSFIKYLSGSTRVLVLCGAGLSASAGIPTSKGSGAFWKGHKATAISSIECFNELPGLVWKYHADRRSLVLDAEPTRGHEVLSEVTTKWVKEAKASKVKKGKKTRFKEMVVLTQNIDGLHEKSNQPRESLYPLHGSLLDFKCSNTTCDFVDKGNLDNPICSALASEKVLDSFSASSDPTEKKLVSLSLQVATKTPDPVYDWPPNPLQGILDALSPTITNEMKAESIPEISKLPHCPKCQSLLRPGVVWFGESLSHTQFDKINAWIDQEPKLDLMLVVGTMADVRPAASFIDIAKSKGARICVVNKDKNHTGGMVVRENKDWVFKGAADEVLPVLFEGVLLN